MASIGEINDKYENNLPSPGKRSRNSQNSKNSKNSKNSRNYSDINETDEDVENIDLNLQDDYFENKEGINNIKQTSKIKFLNTLNKEEEIFKKKKNFPNKRIDTYNDKWEIKNYIGSNTARSNLDNDKTQVLTEFIVPTVENIFLNNKNNSLKKEKNSAKGQTLISRINTRTKAISSSPSSLKKNTKYKDPLVNKVNDDYDLNAKIFDVVNDLNTKLGNIIEKVDLPLKPSSKYQKSSSVQGTERTERALLQAQQNYAKVNQQPKINSRVKKLSELKELPANPTPLKKGKSRSKSNKKNKIKEYDKIIETQLNEIYAKKAKDLGNKLKKMNKIKRPNNKAILNIQNVPNNPTNIQNVHNNVIVGANVNGNNKEKDTKPYHNNNIIGKIEHRELLLQRNIYEKENNKISEKTLDLKYNKSGSLGGQNFLNINGDSFNTELDIIDLLNQDKVLTKKSNKNLPKQYMPSSNPTKKLNLIVNNSNQNHDIKQDNYNKPSPIKIEKDRPLTNDKNKYVNLMQQKNVLLNSANSAFTNKHIPTANSKNINKFINNNNPSVINVINAINKDPVVHVHDSVEIKKSRDISPTLLSIARNEAKLHKKINIPDNKKSIDFINEFGSNANEKNVLKKEEERKNYFHSKMRHLSAGSHHCFPKYQNEFEVNENQTEANKREERIMKNDDYMENIKLKEITKNFIKEIRKENAYGNKSIINVQINSLNNNINVVQREIENSNGNIEL